MVDFVLDAVHAVVSDTAKLSGGLCANRWIAQFPTRDQ